MVIEGINDLNEVFEEEDREILRSYERDGKNALFNEKRLLLSSNPIFIDDSGKKSQNLSVENTFKYYCKKLNMSLEKDNLVHIFPYDEATKNFKRKQLYYEFPNHLEKIIEEINVSRLPRDIMKINPQFLNDLYNVYHEYNNSNSSYLFNLRNFYNDLLVDWNDLAVNEIFYDILEWLFNSLENESVFDLRCKVAKIHISNLGDIKNINENKAEVFSNLSATYDLILSQKSNKFYEYQTMMNDEFFKLLQQKNTIISDKNKSSMSLIVSFLIALYGVYLTIFRTTDSFNWLSSQYNFVYIVFLIACIFMFASTLYEIKLLNITNKKVLSTIQNTYNVNIKLWKKKTKIIWWKDFWFPLIILFIIFINIITLLIFSNFSIEINDIIEKLSYSPKYF
ncbi:hypothetical protein ACFOU0_02840 [Salinicoccus sesuvii]|uniref:Uncharacterized protein n=1 Tax=Salinicoccus sesuvii TaxID=868281 RepID=A0ABV7N1T9_9STAP